MGAHLLVKWPSNFNAKWPKTALKGEAWGAQRALDGQVQRAQRAPIGVVQGAQGPPTEVGWGPRPRVIHFI
jgi:hypothetical protein